MSNAIVKIKFGKIILSEQFYHFGFYRLRRQIDNSLEKISLGQVIIIMKKIKIFTYFSHFLQDEIIKSLY